MKKILSLLALTSLLVVTSSYAQPAEEPELLSKDPRTAQAQMKMYARMSFTKNFHELCKVGYPEKFAYTLKMDTENFEKNNKFDMAKINALKAKHENDYKVDPVKFCENVKAKAKETGVAYMMSDSMEGKNSGILEWNPEY